MDDLRDDEQLMHAYQEGDARAFDVLYTRHRATLFRFVVRQVGDAAIGEELYQEVWLTLIRGRQRWQPRAKLKTYLYNIAHSRIVDHFRARARQGGFAQISYDEDAAEAIACSTEVAADPLDRYADGEALRRCLATLPPEQREAFLLREEADLDGPEIARITGVALEAVKSRLRYAIRRLRACLAGWMEAN